MKNKLIVVLLVFVAILVYWLYPKHNTRINYYDPDVYGMVATKETACSIAEAVWLQVYGDVIYASKPFKAELKDSIWIVEGTLHYDRGGTPYMEISQRDGRILKVIHYK
jgi:hypothetical protein